MSKLRIVLAIHILFFATWGAFLLTSHRSAKTVWLETEPVDPRDYLSGHYVALNFSMNRMSSVQPREAPGSVIYVRLEESQRTATTNQGVVHFWEAAEWSAIAPKPGTSKIWMRGTVTDRTWGGQQYEFGIERFFVSEGSPLRNARSGDVVAEVQVNKEFQPRITRLVKLTRPRGPAGP